MVKLPVPKLWLALRRARRPRARRSRTRELLRGLALLLALGMQVLFVYTLMQPTPPLPVREDELELVLDDILAAVQDDGGFAIPMPRLGSEPRPVARAPLPRPRAATGMTAPAPPQLAEAPPLRTLSPSASTRPVQVAPAPTPLQPASAPRPPAAPTLEAPTPPQLALPAPQTPPLPRPRVLEVDRTPMREWGEAPLVMSTPAPELTPPTAWTPPPELARRVLAPDRPTSVAAAPAAAELQVEPVITPPPTLEVAQTPPLPVPKLVSRDPVARVQPDPVRITPPTPQPPAVAVSSAPPIRVLDTAPPQPLRPDAVDPPAAATPMPVQTITPQVDLAVAPPSRVLETPAPRAVPLAQPAPSAPQSVQPAVQARLEVPVANTRLLEVQSAARTVPTLDASQLTPASTAASTAVQLPDLRVDAPVQATSAERRALSPQRVDLRTLAQAAAQDAVARVQSGPASTVPAAVALDAAALRAAQDAARAGAESASAPGSDAGPAARTGPAGSASEFDTPGPGRGPARSAADLLAGVGSVARDQVEAGARPPAGTRDSFLNRRYDPFYEDLPDRLAQFQTREPNAVRQVLGFLLKSLQGGGVTWRGGTRFEAGSAVFSRPLVDEADVEAAMGILINRWLEMHDGDVRRACDADHADMTPAVRELLCGPVSSSVAPAGVPESP